MEDVFISLLYPSREARELHRDAANRPDISDKVCDALGLTDMFALRSSMLSDFFTEDESILRYRQKTFADMLAVKELRKTLDSIYPILADIHELRHMESESDPAESYLYSITEIELYVSCIDTLAKGLAPVRERLTDGAFAALSDVVCGLSESDYYKELNKKLSALSQRVHEVKSVTIGVNLDAGMVPASAGVISVNSEPFKSGKILDKILRLSFRNDASTCIAELSPIKKNGQSDNASEAMTAALHGAMEDIFRSSVKGWRSIVGEYVLDHTDFLLQLLPEIEFVCKATGVLERLRAHPGCEIAVPTIRPKAEKAFSAVGLYNPRVALAIDDEMVTNDLSFDKEGSIFVLTGPNRGGKSVITVAVGACQAMLQLGMMVPAASAALSPVSGIFTHFPEEADDTIDKGRLGEECARLREIFNALDGYGMVLLDESLSSTGAYEATYIAEEILSALAVKGVRGIFSTHLHDLALATSRINERSLALGGGAVDTLVAGMEQGKRSFKILRAKPDGKSYARDIANKYGLSFESLMEGAEK